MIKIGKFSEKELTDFVNVLEQCNVEWQTCLTSREYFLVLFRLGLGIPKHTRSEVSKKLKISDDQTKLLQSRIIFKLEELVSEDKKRRQTFRIYLFFLNTTKGLDLVFQELLVIGETFFSCLSLPVDVLDISPRTRNTLGRLKLETIDDVLSESNRLTEAANVGEKTIEDLLNAINKTVTEKYFSTLH